jgi:hypothetical protein
MLVRRGYHSSPADLGIPLPCCSAPLPSTLRNSQHAFLDEGTRTRLLERELVSADAVLRPLGWSWSCRLLTWA